MNTKTTPIKDGIKPVPSPTGDAPALNRGAQGAGGQPPTSQVQVNQTRQVVVRTTPVLYPPFIGYYLIKGFRVVDDVVLGRSIKAVEAVGEYHAQSLTTITEEGSAVVIETKWGFEYCGVVKAGAKSTIYIDHIPIELENIEITRCDENEVRQQLRLLEARGLSIESMIDNPWRSIVPYAMTKLRFGGEA
jgi:hypothetical protein